MTLTADTYGEDFLENGELDLFEEDPEHPCNLVMMMMVVMLVMMIMMVVMERLCNMYDVPGMGRR